VLSALARSDVDPCQEAARLAQFLIASHQLPAKPDSVEKYATDPSSPQQPPTDPSH
jgi:hypothetical protein